MRGLSAKLLIVALGSHIWSLFASIHIKSDQNQNEVKLGVGSNIANNHL